MSEDFIDINEDSWKFRIKGQDMLEIRQPTVQEAIDQEELLDKMSKEELDASKLYESNLQYLVKLGGDENLLRSLSRHGFMQVLKTVHHDAKKN